LIGKDLVNVTNERVKNVKKVLYGALFGCFVLMFILGLIMTIFYPPFFIILLMVLLLMVLMGLVYLRERRTFSGIMAITVRENGMDIHFDIKHSQFYPWDSIKYLSVIPVTQYMNARDQNGYIVLKGKIGMYFLNPEVAEVAIAAYERAMGRSPPAKTMLG